MILLPIHKSNRFLIIAICTLLVTLASFFVKTYRNGIVGNNCGPKENELCIEPVLQAGYPFSYVVDNTGVSVVGKLDPIVEDKFIFGHFLLDTFLYFLILAGVSSFVMKYINKD